MTRPVVRGLQRWVAGRLRRGYAAPQEMNHGWLLEVLGLLSVLDSLFRGQDQIVRTISARTVQEALGLAAREDFKLFQVGYVRVGYEWDTAQSIPTLGITYAGNRAAATSAVAQDVGSMHWIGLALWVVAAAAGVLIATVVVLFGLYLLDVAAAGAGAGRSEFDCLGDACVRESWLVGAGLIIGAIVVVGGVFPAFLSSPRTLRAATVLAWSATGALLLWALAVAAINRDSAVPLYPLPAAVAMVLAIGCHARLRLKGGRLLRT